MAYKIKKPKTVTRKIKKFIHKGKEYDNYTIVKGKKFFFRTQPDGIHETIYNEKGEEIGEMD